jgi:uncharacterized protein
MKFYEQQTGASNVIRACEPGLVRVNDTVCTESLIVTPAEFEPDWPVSHASELSLENLFGLLDYDPEIILLGTGNRHLLLDQQLLLDFMVRGVGIEVMTTDAACRTYNVLLGEDRAVLAALIVEPHSS